jgi:tetratricopeptide (TPR) repeat protein
MHEYSVRDVERLVHLPRSIIRSLVEAGFVSPARGPRNTWLFSFQDLIVLRTARTLAAAKVPPRRIIKSVKELRRHLPESMPLSGLSISAGADSVVVKEGATRWQAESGQYLLAFEGDPDDGTLSVMEQLPAETPSEAEHWYEKGRALEGTDVAAAIQAYSRAVEADPALLKARIDLGCLLHEAGRLEEAEKVYRDAIRSGGHDPVLLYDLAVLLEDMGRKEEAMATYEAALLRDPLLADCHYNLALLCEGLMKPQEAIRHMSEYRRLTSRK